MTTIKFDGLTVHLGEPIEAMASIGHAWFPSLARFPSGELLLAYSLVADTNENHFDLSGYQVSADGGHTWTPRYDILPEHQQMIYLPQADEALLALPAYLYTLTPGAQHNFCGAATRFEQAGRRVIFEPQRVRLVDWPWPVAILPNPYRPHQQRVNFCFDGDALLVDGQLIATLYGSKAGDDLYSVVVATSADGGYTWHYLATVAGPESVPAAPRGHGPAEPSLVQLADGDLMCVMRMGGGADFPLRRSYSRDGGRTWSPPDVLPAGSVEPSLKRLHNGVLALSTGRPGIFLWLSSDGRGERWQSIDLLAHHNRWAPGADYQITPAQTTAYTEIIEVAPNHLLLAYDHTPFGWQPTPASSNEHNRIFLLPFTVETASLG